MRRDFFVAIRIGAEGCTAQPRHSPDQRLIKLLPERGGPLECLVIETRSKKSACKLIYREQIEAQGWPTVLAQRIEAVVELDHCGASIGFQLIVAAKRDQRIGLLGPCGENSAGAMVLE